MCFSSLLNLSNIPFSLVLPSTRFILFLLLLNISVYILIGPTVILCTGELIMSHEKVARLPGELHKEPWGECWPLQQPKSIYRLTAFPPSTAISTLGITEFVCRNILCSCIIPIWSMRKYAEEKSTQKYEWLHSVHPTWAKMDWEVPSCGPCL